MIQVYKKNGLFIIEETCRETIYPNLTKEEAIDLLKKFDREEPEDRCDFAIKEENINFKWASLDDKDKIDFAVAELIKFKETLIKFLQDEGFYENEWYDLFDKIDQQIKELKEKDNG